MSAADIPRSIRQPERVLRFGRLRQDDDGHWYAVPNGEVAEFDAMSAAVEGRTYLEAARLYDAIESRFGRYRIDGPQSVAILIPEA